MVNWHVLPLSPHLNLTCLQISVLLPFFQHLSLLIYTPPYFLISSPPCSSPLPCNATADLLHPLIQQLIWAYKFHKALWSLSPRSPRGNHESVPQIDDGVRSGWRGGGSVKGRWEVEEVTETAVEGEKVLSGNAEEVRERGGEKEMQWSAEKRATIIKTWGVSNKIMAARQEWKRDNRDLFDRENKSIYPLSFQVQDL